MKSSLSISRDGWMQGVIHKKSPYFNHRPDGEVISLLVIHNISLPASHFGTGYVEELFMGCLNYDAHESFSDLQGVEVSSHFFINRMGEVIQFVSTEDRAWHAGVSVFRGKENCNDYSIGVELEGTDDLAYTDVQYKTLVQLSKSLMQKYPIKKNHIVGHSDISSGRKTDPGKHFDWQRYLQALEAKV